MIMLRSLDSIMDVMVFDKMSNCLDIFFTLRIRLQRKMSRCIDIFAFFSLVNDLKVANNMPLPKWLKIRHNRSLVRWAYGV
ncbi:hypothetical protein HMPREF9103_01372 [Lentilactobacillus parafarraginis F0439]|uniref:Uncharacterized protein n=1 Tax=Lentilactobacillus parafarraginis F0439 TaxID=797515 RepID=G9ZNR9_9LACO|nr:hypothetical protein HMPREF9103_01372 [Lentilactobacillus parafarraginis F0439]